MNPLEKIYPYVPVWAQNIGISLYGFAYYDERFGGDFEKYTADFKKRDRISPQEMDAYVEERLREVTLQAFRNVPYYRERWGKAGISFSALTRITPGKLPSLPITPKKDLRLHPKLFLAEDRSRKFKLHQYDTSGSTGTPIACFYTSQDHRKFMAARQARSFAWAGTSIRKPRSMIGGRSVVPSAAAKPPYYRYNFIEKQVYFSAFHISPATVSDYLEGFHRYRPRVLTGYAYSHYLLGRMMAEQGRALNYQPDAAILSSEKLSPEMKQVIQASFRARAYEEYSAVENCALATECEYGNLHVSPDFGIVEIVDPSGQPVPPGQEGRILCTGLINHAQPLIRYEIGDLGVWWDKQCECGRNHLPVLKEIAGRIEDVVVGPGGREMVRFHGIFINLPHVLEGQVIQEKRDAFTVKVVALAGFGEEEENLIRKRFYERLGEVHVRIERVSRLERTQGGKFQAVKSYVTSEGSHG